MRYYLYPYKKGDLREVIEKGFLNVLTGSCVGVFNLPIKVEEFKSFLFQKADLEQVNSRVFYWFPDIVVNVKDFYLKESEDGASLGFYISLEVADGSTLEIVV